MFGLGLGGFVGPIPGVPIRRIHVNIQICHDPSGTKLGLYAP